jgi:hypothetical protein
MTDEAKMTQSFVAIPLGVKVVNRIIPYLMPSFKSKAVADSAGRFQKSLQAIQRLLAAASNCGEMGVRLGILTRSQASERHSRSKFSSFVIA